MGVLPLWLIAGLGNPGESYRRTRHNLGFWTVEELAARAGAQWDRWDGGGWMLAAPGEIAAQPVVFLKPLRWMNVSGGAIRSALCHWSLSPDRLVVACDDVALPDGRIRVRIGGSSGGHKGLASIIEAVGSDGFVRVRVGAGSERDPDQDLSDFVLQPLTAGQHEWYASACHVAAEAIALAVTRGGFVPTTLRVQCMPGADDTHAHAEDADRVRRSAHPAAEDPEARLRCGVGGGPPTEGS